LQPHGTNYVNLVVKEWISTMQAPAEHPARRYVKVAPPTVHAGVGAALRLAFRMDGEIRSLADFEDLLERLD
jgi:hypothetical protein